MKIWLYEIVRAGWKVIQNLLPLCSDLQSTTSRAGSPEGSEQWGLDKDRLGTMRMGWIPTQRGRNLNWSLTTSNNLPSMTAEMAEVGIFHNEGKPTSGTAIWKAGEKHPVGSGNAVALAAVPFQHGEPRDKWPSAPERIWLCFTSVFQISRKTSLVCGPH